MNNFDTYVNWLESIQLQTKMETLTDKELDYCISQRFGSHPNTIKNHRQYLMNSGLIVRSKKGWFWEIMPKEKRMLEKFK